ncbi:hypothetical protein [Methylobacterium trifolii]|uniref:hypothetical protein n=1 Tax=Methylobacterium trifolii TaxID=1003092 RepID=UPI001EDCADCA|nr:hypothetical protein [Methylobacterium trifolii]
MRRAVDWAFRDRRTGAITIGQWPNLPLWLFLGLTALAWAAGGLGDPSGAAIAILRIAARLCLAWWALDEVLRGVNPWRRFLGGVVLAGQAILLVAAWDPGGWQNVSVAYAIRTVA